MTDDTRPKQTDYEVIDSISVAAFDVDARIFRTLWHSIVRTPDVVRAAIKGDYTRYLSPIRVLVAVFGIQFAVAAIFGAPMNLTVESMGAAENPERFATWLNGIDPITIDRAMEDALSLLLWPIMIVSSLPYLILLKLYRPALKFWTHLCVFLVPTNASTFAFIALTPAVMISEGLIMVAMIAMFVVYFVTTGWLIARFYSRSVIGTVMRIGGFIIMLPVTLILSGISQFVAAYWILDSQFGLSLLDLFNP